MIGCVLRVRAQIGSLVIPIQIKKKSLVLNVRRFLQVYNNGKWTEARFHSFIKSALRSASQRWPPKYSTLADAKRGKKINKASGRLAEHYLCAACGGEYPAKEIQVDHIHPVINPNTGFTSWDDVIVRMFCEKEGYQILCKPCHKAKSNVERHQAKERKTNDTSK